MLFGFCYKIIMLSLNRECFQNMNIVLVLLMLKGVCGVVGLGYKKFWIKKVLSVSD